MRWKGAVRAIQTSIRSASREANRNQKIQAKLQSLDDSQSAFSAYESYIDNITSIHVHCISDPIDWQSILNQPPPSKPIRANDLESDAQTKFETFEPSLLNKLFNNEAKKKEILREKIATAIAKDDEIHQNNLSQYREKHALWEKRLTLAKRLLKNDYLAYIDTINEFNPFTNIENLGTGIEFIVDINGNITVSICVHSDQVIPKEKYSLRQSGTLSLKEMPKSEFNTLYQDYVSSCTLRIAAELFALLPIERVLVNAKDNLLNPKTGYVEEQTILSVMLMRKTFEQINLHHIDPSEAMKNFLHKMRFKKTTGFDIIEPLSFDEIGPILNN